MSKYLVVALLNLNKMNRLQLRKIIVAFIGTFIGLSIVAFFTFNSHQALLVPSFGASAVLLYAAEHVPMAQPKNVFGGHLISAIIGVTVYQLWGLEWWTLALGVTLAVVSMIFTNTLHPPGGATAFTAIFTHQGYTFVFEPVALGITILVGTALILHNFMGQRRYPTRSKK